MDATRLTYELSPDHRQDLADDEPVAEHAEGRQVLLDGGRRPEVGPDVGRHVQRRDRREPQAPRRAPRRELPHGPPIRRAVDAARAGRRASGGATRTTSSLMPSPLPRRARRRPVDERLELLVVVRQRLGEREEPPDGVLGSAEAHLDPAGLDRHALGEAASRASSASIGTATRIPVSRAWRSAVTTRSRRVASPRKAARCRYFRSCRRSAVRRRTRDAPTSSAPNVRISCAARARDTPNSRSTSRRVSRSRSRASSWRMASGTAMSHRAGPASGRPRLTQPM